MNADVQTEAIALIGRWVKAKEALIDLAVRMQDGRTLLLDREVEKLWIEIDSVEHAMKDLWSVHERSEG